MSKDPDASLVIEETNHGILHSWHVLSGQYILKVLLIKNRLRIYFSHSNFLILYFDGMMFCMPSRDTLKLLFIHDSGGGITSPYFRAEEKGLLLIGRRHGAHR